MELSLRPKEVKASQINVVITPGGPSQKNALAQTEKDHTLQLAQNIYDINRHNINMKIIRDKDGLHAPLKLSAEIGAAKKVGRLPFLQSSNAMFDALTGRDEMIDFSDFLGTEDTFEHLRQPHAVTEKYLGIFEGH